MYIKNLLSQNIDIQKDKIQLYQNQVFVTDNVEGIVPDFLQMLRGVIDSPDIPLNVSRSYLQADGAVKKISSYITKKVGDKLSSLFKNDREGFEKKWNDIKIVLEYGMLSEDKFYEKAGAFVLYPTVNDKYFTLDELKENLKETQTDKDGKLIVFTKNKNGEVDKSFATRLKSIAADPIFGKLPEVLTGLPSNVIFAILSVFLSSKNSIIIKLKQQHL
mgnify:CR=1 FL=1